jgi:hypothetical protein
MQVEPRQAGFSEIEDNFDLHQFDLMYFKSIISMPGQADNRRDRRGGLLPEHHTRKTT